MIERITIATFGLLCGYWAASSQLGAEVILLTSAGAFSIYCAVRAREEWNTRKAHDVWTRSIDDAARRERARVFAHQIRNGEFND